VFTYKHDGFFALKVWG